MTEQSTRLALLLALQYCLADAKISTSAHLSEWCLSTEITWHWH